MNMFMDTHKQEREELVSLRTELRCNIERCFQSTNDLTALLGQCQLQQPNHEQYQYNHTNTLRANCQSLILKLETIHSFVESETERQRALLSEDEFKMMFETSSDFRKKLETASKINSNTKASALAILGCIHTKCFIKGLIAGIGHLEKAAIATTNLGTLLVSEDVDARHIFTILHSERRMELTYDLKANLDHLKRFVDQFYDHVETIKGGLAVLVHPN